MNNDGTPGARRATQWVDSNIPTQVWCDGSTPCMVADGEKPGDAHGHWRGGNPLKLSKALRIIADVARASPDIDIDAIIRNWVP